MSGSKQKTYVYIHLYVSSMTICAEECMYTSLAPFERWVFEIVSDRCAWRPLFFSSMAAHICEPAFCIGLGKNVSNKMRFLILVHGAVGHATSII